VDSGHLLTVRADGVLVLAVEESEAVSQQFNAYGDPEHDGGWLQAGNGRYVSALSGEQVCADQDRNGAPARIVLKPVDEKFRLCRRGGNESADTYLAVQENTLVWRTIDQADETAGLFLRTIVTEGLKALKIAGMGADLRLVCLAGENLTRINLTAANLSGADLSGAVLDTAILTSARVDRTRFIGCDLSKANLTSVSGRGADFTNTCLSQQTLFSGASLPEADFRGTRSQGARVSFSGLQAPQANFTGASLPDVLFDGTRLQGAMLVDADFSRASMSGADFTGAVMTLVKLKDALFQGTNFSRAILAGADFTDADATDAVFIDADLTNVRLCKAKGTRRLNLCGTRLVGADLSQLDLRDAGISATTNFTQARLDGVNLAGKRLDRVIFHNASLREATLDHASLERTVLTGADLSGASITGSVSFVGANLSNATLTGANLSGGQFGPLKRVGEIEAAHAVSLDAGCLPSHLAGFLPVGNDSGKTNAVVHVRESGQAWLVEHEGVPLLLRRCGDTLEVSQEDSAVSAAILTNAYMPDVILSDANLYAVNMAGVQWYGSGAKADNANLEQVNLSGANLATMDLSQARLYGADLSYASLVNANLAQAKLSPTQGSKPVSLAFSSLQGAVFTEATLAGADLTNAAVALPIESLSGQNWVGTPIFTVEGLWSDTLDRRVLPAELRAVFENAGYPLQASAQVEVWVAGKSWVISSWPPADDLHYKGYVTFILTREDLSWGAYLQVHGGSPLRIVRRNEDNELQPVTIAFGPSQGLLDTLDGESTCPSGLRYNMKDRGFAIQHLMTPGQPPHPPVCVPSPTTWC
jgi:uncharacterized protein YjbI with pentapeptide repeats